MKCHVCGSEMNSIITNLPFKVNDLTIVILRDLPVYQCSNCSEYLLADYVLKQVERIFDKVNQNTEIEIIMYAEAA
jgi:YgiT-type zinc finger domain-containing protein